MSFIAKLREKPLWSGAMLAFISVPAIVLVSKFVGLIRESLLTKLLGLGASLDLFVVFTTVPAYVLSYVMGPFSVAFFASLTAPGNSAWPLARRLGPWLIYGGFGAAALAFIAAFFIAPRMDMTGVTSGAYYTIAAVCALTLPCAVINGMAICLLHAAKKHNTAILLAVVQPWGFVILLVAVDHLSGEALFEPVGLAYAASFVLSLAVSVAMTLRGQRRDTGEGTADIAAFRSHLGLTTLETAGFYANQLATMFFAGLSGVGSIAANGLAARVMLMPVSLLFTPLSPVLQNIYRTQEPARRRRIFARAYGLLLLAITILMIAILYFGADVIRLFFQRGAFSAEDTARVAGLLLPYSAYVVFIAANQLCAAVAFINGTGKRYTFIMLGNYAASNLLKIPMLSAYGLEGVIWAAVATEAVAAAVNGWIQFSGRGQATEEAA